MGFGPAVANKEGKRVLHHISASQVNTHMSCPHRWYAEKVEGAPSFADWSWAESGVAAHEILEQQVGALIGKEFDDSRRRILDPKVIEEAENLVSWFKWEDYFEEHQIIDVEMDLILNLTTLYADEENPQELPLLVGSMDVVSINADGIMVVTDWKTGYGAYKGVDIQAQAYALGIMQNMDVEEVIFRRIYPRLPGEERGTKRVEEHYFNEIDAKRYAASIKHIALKMKRTVESEITPKVTASDSCVHCPVAYNCPIAKSAAFSPGELTAKLKVLKAAEKQVKEALKATVEKGGDFYVGDEHYGFTQSESYRSPKELKGDDILKILIEKAPELLYGTRVSVNTEIKELLEEEGYEGFKNVGRSTFKWLNEKELKDAAKAKRNAQKTAAETQIAA